MNFMEKLNIFITQKNNYLTTTSMYYNLEGGTVTNSVYQYEYFFNDSDYPTIRSNNGDIYSTFEYK